MAKNVPVRLIEVGPRDGLQNESIVLDTTIKAQLIERLVQAGITAVEVTSFVRPDRVPQLNDATELTAQLNYQPQVRYISLVPNMRGLESAEAAGVEEIAVFAAASDAFSEANIGRTIDDSLDSYRAVTEKALASGMRIRGYVSTIIGCPFSGRVPQDNVRRVTTALAEMGCEEISLGDTIGVARPHEIAKLFTVLGADVGLDKLAGHFHDTYGMGLANSLAALDVGVRALDASIGGLGGCPFAGRGATGNLATEDLVYALANSDYDLGVDLDALVGINAWLSAEMGRELPSKAARALHTKRSSDT